ncbi:MAG: succinyl-diaminopimelate desuccinylase [Gammaproteobacteria bacterium]|nr:succinyl-diaminopimelate desuccinylase [Gammaproteobacteria bacterium]
MRDAVFALAHELIRRRSVTPDDAGCQPLIGARLAASGFAIEALPCAEVSNLWATHGSGDPLVVLAGHTDVVPPGPLENWTSDPFEPAVRDGRLYGRGAADMKGGLAAMIVAAEFFVAEHPGHAGTLAFLVTSDEEGPARDGTRRVIDTLMQRGIRIEYCLVGEASGRERAGDEIRIGRRGSLTGTITVRGTQGHVAYPDEADNAAHRLLAALGELAALGWPAGDPQFPPCSFQIANVNAGTGADNVIPGEASAQCNFRYPPPLEPGTLQQIVAAVLARHAPRHELAWRDGGRPFLSRAGALRRAAVAAIERRTGITPVLSTGGGTSDGRFIAPAGAEVIELGPARATIHKADECVALADLDALAGIYTSTLSALLAPPG